MLRYPYTITPETNGTFLVAVAGIPGAFTACRSEAEARDMNAERYNRLHPDKESRIPYVRQLLDKEEGVFVAASDYVQILGDSISKYFPKALHTLGTYGFGRSEDRESLRDFFEVDARHITAAALYALMKEGRVSKELVQQAILELGIDSEKRNPLNS